MTIIKSKLYPPACLTKLLPRPRLEQYANWDMLPRFIFVHAPAGFGKTTLLYQWRAKLSENGASVAWYSLDDSDNDEVAFKEHLVASLRLSIEEDTEEHNISNVVSSIKEHFHTSSFVAEIFNQLTIKGKEFVLILDDFHVISNKNLLKSIINLLEYAPPGFHLIIASRESAQFSISSLMAKGQAYGVDASELRLNTEEIEDYIQTIQGLSLSAESKEQLQSKTGGWIAGLRMAALATNKVAVGEASNFQLENDDKSLRDYLTEQVLDKQSERIKNFLLKTAFLPRLTADLCDQVVGINDSAELLVEISYKGLFVVTLDVGWYRYDHSFSELLQEYARQSMPDLIPHLVAKACDWLVNNNFYIEAVGHALKNKAYDIAEEIITRNSLDVLKRGMTTTILVWLDQLPQSLENYDISFQLHVAWSLILVRRPDEAVEILDRIERENNNKDQDLNTRIEVARNSALAWQDDQIVAKKRMKDIQATGLIKDPWDKAGSNNIILYCCTIDGDIVTATQAYGKVINIADSDYSMIYAKVLMGMCLKSRGQLNEAVALFEDALILAVSKSESNSVMASLAASNLAEVFYEWNDLEGCKKLIGSRMTIIDETSLNDILISVYSSMIRIVDHFEGYAEAVKFIQHGLEVAYSQAYGLRLEVALHREKIRLLIARENLSEAEDLLNLMEARFADNTVKINPYINRQITEYITVSKARLLACKGDYEQAGELISNMIEVAENDFRRYKAIRLKIEYAVITHMSGAADAALQQLDDVLRAAEPQNFIRSFVDVGRPFFQLFNDYLAYRQSGVNKDARSVSPQYLQAIKNAIESEKNDLSSSGSEPTQANSGLYAAYGLSERQYQILLQIAAGYPNKKIAILMNLSVDTVKWHLKQIYQKLSVANRTEAVQKAFECNLISAQDVVVGQ